MSPDDLLTDDYVAELLVKEAKDSSLKYSAIGLDAFKSTKRPANQPKPNTRFLNNIIRDTNSHNRALLAKEEAESQAKLRDLEDAEQKKKKDEERKLRKTNPGPSDTRKRMLGDIAAILGGPSKRRKTDKAVNNASDSVEPAAEGTSRRQRKSSAANVGDDTDSKKKVGRKDRSVERSRSSRHSHHREREDGEGGSSSSHPRRHKHHERSPQRTSRSHRRRSSPAKRHERDASSHQDSSDSDPLDEFIGPAPAAKSAVRRRGRGANATASGIDSRFAPDYDPKRDVTPELEDGDDWDREAEAFRDRQKWKQQGADRLRSAGFTEEQVTKWEKGDQEDVADVRWIKAGTQREWDRGKVANANRTTSPSSDADK